MKRKKDQRQRVVLEVVAFATHSPFRHLSLLNQWSKESYRLRPKFQYAGRNQRNEQVTQLYLKCTGRAGDSLTACGSLGKLRQRTQAVFGVTAQGQGPCGRLILVVLPTAAVAVRVLEIG